LIKKAPFSRLAKTEKAEFTHVNEHFSGKRNEENGVFLQRLSSKPVVFILFLGKHRQVIISSLKRLLDMA
jgi:hypothetical protein